MNRSADYVRNIAKVYIFQENYAALVRKRAAVFFAEIGRVLRIDPTDKERLSENASIIAAYAGRPQEDAEEVKALLSELLQMVEAKGTGKAMDLSYEKMRSYVDTMDSLLEGRKTA